jgi:hypothetical protein
MQSIDSLIESARDSRLERQPQYVQELIHRMALRLEVEHKYAEAMRRETDAEIAAARALLTDGPADSNTYLSLGGVLRADEDDDGNSRPLGRDVFVEFRPEGAEVGEGFAVRMVDGKLEISGPGRFVIEPVHSSSVRIVPAGE